MHISLSRFCKHFKRFIHVFSSELFLYFYVYSRVANRRRYSMPSEYTGTANHFRNIH